MSLKTYLGVLLLSILFTACGDKGEVLPPDNVAGEWADSLVLAQICGQVLFFGLEFDLMQSGNKVTGSTTFITVNNQNQLVGIDGSFTGNISGDTLKGTATYPIEDDALKFSVSVKHRDETLSGTLSEATTIACNDGSKSSLVGETVLITEAKNPVVADALEPNNQATQAKTLFPGKPINNLTISASDVDWFKFSLTETTFVGAIVELFSEFPVRLQLFNQSANLIATKDMGTELETQINLLGITPTLQAGTYYLAVSAGDDSGYTGNHNANGKYSLELITDTNPQYFYEPNETVETAHSIPNNFSTRAYLAYQDVDIFKFTLDTEGLVNLKIQADNSEQLPVELYTSNGMPSYDHDNNPDTFLYALESGDYYIKIDGKYTGGTRYQLILETSNFPDNDYEPNETRETAIAIPIEFEEILFTSPDDSDWFQFTVEQPLQATIRLSIDHDLYLDFYRETEHIDSLSSNRLEVTRVLTSGTYYLRTYGATSIFSYSLTMTPSALPDAAFEPNESFNDAIAMTLPFNQTLASTSNAFEATFDDDWFRFNLSAQQLLSITVDLESFGYVQGEIYNDQGAVLADLSTSYPNPHDFVLEAGTYYLKLRGTSFIGFLYDVDISSEAIPDQEYEPNDTQAEAYAIPTTFSDDNLLVYGYPSGPDNDFYSFNLLQTTQIQIQIEGRINSTLFDKDGQQVMSLFAGLSEPILPAGKYIIGVSSIDEANRYRLALNIK
jgi:hypothetical protein